MTTALDTNILLRYVEPTSSLYPVTLAALAALQASGDDFRIFPQTVYEFWATATRPIAANGLGFSTAECLGKLNDLRQLFGLLPDQPTLFAEWESLVVTHQCHGRVSFDARLVAAMRTHGLTRLLTFNGGDFARYPYLTVLDPHAVAASTPPTNLNP